MNKLGLSICVAVLLLFSGCASNGFLMARAKVTMFGPAYTPKYDDATIDIYMAGAPIQPYVEFAKIKCGDTNDKWSMEQILKKAREIGADGIIVIGKASTSAVGIPIGYSIYVVSEEHGLTAIAIKYKAH